MVWIGGVWYCGVLPGMERQGTYSYFRCGFVMWGGVRHKLGIVRFGIILIFAELFGEDWHGDAMFCLARSGRERQGKLYSYFRSANVMYGEVGYGAVWTHIHIHGMVLSSQVRWGIVRQG
jgi:hypothetical protein